ncbi:MAG: hypothetical protein KAS72_14755 [Phycisphaerales bacterium]|nr:hypothetical protein [Phycisphaerales bacterium]
MNQMNEPMLNPDDAQAVDRLVEAGFDAQAAVNAEPARQRRIERAAALLAALDALPDERAGDDLVDQTLARIQSAIDGEEQQRRFDTQAAALATGPIRSRWSLGLRELAGVAAVILLGLSALWPLMNGSTSVDGPLWDAPQGTITAGFAGSQAMEPVGPPARSGQPLVMVDKHNPLKAIIIINDQPREFLISSRWQDRVVRYPDGTVKRFRQPVLLFEPVDRTANPADAASP